MRSLLIIVIFVVSTNSFAYDRADEVLSNCDANPSEGLEEAMKSLHCSGYLTGIVDGVLMVQSVASNQPYICLPGGATSGGQTLKAVTQWLKNNPEVANHSARIGVIKALIALYPCPQ